ncbi:MAG TPA: FliH/SctL family protein [Acidobacteriaceae bacterium]|jgi:flagellar assembly protein FliH|nr:FliH/SctL family protein [Acidobacteriaceae bacterium]
MLSKIIEKSAAQRNAEAFLLDRVTHVPAQPSNSSTPENADSPEVQALRLRIAQLEKDLAETEAAAYARGRREAEAEARQRYGATMQNTAERLAQSVKQLAEVRPRLCKEAEADILRLAMAIAQRILHRQLAIDPEALVALAKVSLDRVGRQEQIRVRVNPALREPVLAVLTRLSSRPIDVLADTNLEAGGLIFETSRGHLDASIHSQLDEIERGLVDRLSNRPEGRS